MGLNHFLSNDPMKLLGMLNDQLADLASRMHVNALVLYIAAGVVAALVGLAGMHLAKMFCMLGLGGIGYFVGVELFQYLVAEVSALSKMPSYLSYVFGAVIAIVFFVFGWKKCLHAMFALFAVLGYVLVIHYVDDNAWLALGGAVLLAMISTLCMKVAFIAFTSAVGGFTLVSVLGAAWPKISFLQLGDRKSALWVALGVAIVMMVFQLLTTRRYRVVEN